MSPAREKSIEVTAEDAAVMSMAANASPSPSSSIRQQGNSSNANANISSSSSVKKKLTKLMKPMGKNLPHLRSPKLNDLSSRPYDNCTAGAAGGGDADNLSYNSESMGQMSVTPTVASLDTVKVSNRNARSLLVDAPLQGHGQGSTHKGGKKTPWKKLKQFMGLPPSNHIHSNKNPGSEELPRPSLQQMQQQRVHAQSADFLCHEGLSSNGAGPTSANSNSIMDARRRRISSMDVPTKSSRSKKQQQAQSQMLRKQQARQDEALRGKLDGMDLLFLGPAHLISLERQHAKTTKAGSSSTPWEPSPSFSFAGRSTQYSSQQIVTDMVQRSLRQDAPEIVLEGFFRDDRWVVNPDMPNRKQNSSSSITSIGSGNNSSNNIVVDVDGETIPEGLPPLQLTDEEDHSHSTTAPDEIPRHKLWGSMWGTDTKPPPKPSHMTSVEDIEPDADSILEMAASCSVPIDVDEDTFMIGNAHHLQAVHELASVPLQHAQFGEAMAIFKRILRGIEIQENDALRHLEGVTLHNMSVIAMWQEDYEHSLDLAGKAVKARLQYLPEGHPDIAVSLVRQGYAYFALERFEMAEASFHAALEKLTEDNVVKAKVLLNLGVARYQRGDDSGALKNFKDALEIQRLWLQGPVRRETTVFGAAVMLGNMGKIHIKRGNYDLAVAVYEESLLLQTSILRADHDLVLDNLVSLALAWAFNSEPLKAGQILNGVLRSQLNRLGPATIEVVETTGAIGNLHFGLGNYEDALKCFAPVLKWQKANLDPEHPALRKTKDIMKLIKKSIQAVWV